MKQIFLFFVLATSLLLKAEDGKLPGKFAISQTDSVSFSQGILSFKNNIWSFSPKQYVDLSFVLTDTCLFRWSYQNSNYGTSKEELGDVVWNFKDWGENAISNGGNQPNMWRTLSYDEWDYLIMHTYRKYIAITSDTAQYVYGVVLFPNNFEDPSLNQMTTEINDSVWLSWEKKGAVLFQDCVFQEGCNHYWTSTGSPVGDYLISYNAHYLNVSKLSMQSEIYYFELKSSVDYIDLGCVRLVYGTPTTSDLTQIKFRTQASKVVQNGRLIITRNGLQYDVLGRLQ